MEGRNSASAKYPSMVPCKTARFCGIKRIPLQFLQTLTLIFCVYHLFSMPLPLPPEVAFTMCNLNYDKGLLTDASPEVFLLPVPASFFHQKIICFFKLLYKILLPLHRKQNVYNLFIFNLSSSFPTHHFFPISVPQ